MSLLYLLLALMTSHSVYAAAEDPIEPTCDRAQMIPDTVPLPEGLVTIASSEKDRSKANGCFFTKNRVALLTMLRLANPSKDDPQENNRRLDKVHALLEEGVNKDLPNRCPDCLNGYKCHFNGEWGDYSECPGCKRRGGDNFQDEARGNLITTAAEHCNNTLWKELSKETGPRDLIKHLAHYKVIGSLYLLTVNKWLQQKLIHNFQANDDPSSGKLPCELGGSLNGESRYILTTGPQLNLTEKSQLIFEPLRNNLGTIDDITEAALGYLLSDKMKQNAKDAEVVVIDRDTLKSLINTYRPQPKPRKKGSCTLL